uniref:SET domain-containing protein n=1 Tax=Grammatophora oceanica TaxID=210454 RepID=A0A7S1VUD5_9STRA
MVVVGDGSAPSLATVQDDSILPRDLLARHVVTNHAMVHMYDEPLSKPLPSTYIVSFVSDQPKGAMSYAMFVRKNGPAIDVDFVNSMNPGMKTIPTLIYDGTTHVGYILISRVWEQWFCRSEYGRKLAVCTEFLPMWFDSENHRYDFEVRQHPVKGRSLHATKAISKGQYVIPNDAALSLRLDRQKWEALNKFIEDFPQATLYKDVRDFIVIYGFESEALGVTGWATSIACNNTFCNHACTDAEENVHYVTSALADSKGDWEYLAPPVMRRGELLSVLVEATRDIEAGEEIQTDYSTFRTVVGDDEAHNRFIESMCNTGEGYVPVDESGGGENEEL